MLPIQGNCPDDSFLPSVSRWTNSVKSHPSERCSRAVTNYYSIMLFQPNAIRLYISAQALCHICLLPTEYFYITKLPTCCILMRFILVIFLFFQILLVSDYILSTTLLLSISIYFHFHPVSALRSLPRATSPMLFPSFIIHISRT